MSHDTPHDPAHGQHAHGVGHVVSPKILIATALALLALTAMTVFAAKIKFEAIEMEELNIILALGIALVKASLVCLFFMHLRWDRPFNAFVLICSLAFVALFITFAMTDSSEYKPEVEAYVRTLPEGISPTIKAELDKLPPPLPESELPKHE
jgi:cytochrome c oxidase subunit IV